MPLPESPQLPPHHHFNMGNHQLVIFLCGGLGWGWGAEEEEEEEEEEDDEKEEEE